MKTESPSRCRHCSRPKEEHHGETLRCPSISRIAKNIGLKVIFAVEYTPPTTFEATDTTVR